MKIALVCRAFPTQRPGGMLFVCQDRAGALSKWEEVLVITTSLNGKDSVTTIGAEDGTGSYEVMHTKSPTIQYSDDFASETARICRAWKPDIIHLDSFDRSRPWWREFAGKAKLAVTMHGFAPGAFMTEWNLWRDGLRVEPPGFNASEMDHERKFMAEFDACLAISRNELFQMQSWYGLKNAHLVYNPIAPYFFSEPTTPVPQDGYAMSSGLPSTSGNRHFDRAAEACRKIGVAFQSPQSLPRRDLVKVYDGARCLVLPTSWAQGYDTAVCEALARRRPVVAAATGSYAMEAYDNPAIHLVPQNDADALADAIQSQLPEVPASAANRHMPMFHAERWLEVLA